MDILASTPVLSNSAKAAALSMIGGDFAPLFRAELAAKDLAYVGDHAAGLATPAPMVLAAHAVMVQAIACNYGADHLTGVIRLYRDR